MTTRRRILGTIGTAASIAITGCSGGGGVSQSPEEVTKSYLSAYFDGNYEDARSHTTGQKREEITQERVAKLSARSAKLESVTSSEKTNGEAAVTYISSQETALGNFTPTNTALLVNQDGQWLIAAVLSEKQDAEIASNFDGIDDRDPGDVARSFVNSYYKADYNAIMANSTSEYKEHIQKVTLSNNIDLINMSITNINRSESTSNVIAELKFEKNTSKYNIEMKKTTGEWLVNGFEHEF